MLAYQIKQENVEIEFHSEDLPPVTAVQNAMKKPGNLTVDSAEPQPATKGTIGAYEADE